MKYVDKNYLGLNCYLESVELTKEKMKEKLDSFLKDNNIKFSDMRDKYELDRMPMGSAHVFSTNDIEQVYGHLRGFICDTCFENKWYDLDDPEDVPDISKNHDELPWREKVYELLCTPCGAEWMLTVNEDVKIDE